MRSLAIVGGLAIAGFVLLAACQPATPSPTPFPTPTDSLPSPTPEFTPEPTPTPEAVRVPEGLYPPDVRTDIPEIDLVLEAVANQDLETIKGLMRLSEVPCDNIPSPIYSGPTCFGIEEGTPIPAFPSWLCYPRYFSTVGEAQSNYEYLYNADPIPYVYAVYRSPRSLENGDPVAYEILLASGLNDHLAHIIFLNPEGQIVRIDWCTVPWRMLPDGVDFILPPLPPALDAIKSALSEAQRTLDALRIASGEDVPCGEPCVRDEDFGRLVQGSIELCQKIEPSSYRQRPDYDPQKHEALIAAYEQACDILFAAEYKLGAPQENNEDWMAAVLEAKEILIRAGVPQE